MSSSEQARTTARRARPTTAVVLAVSLALAVAAVVVAVLGYQAVAARSSSAASPVATADRDGPGLPQPPDGSGPAVLDGVTVDDGLVPDGVTVFDGEFPAVANLDPDLLSALRRAATAAGGAGVEVVVNSGWRSPAYQDQLLREAVREYGSEAEAARWVATAETSAHVTGDAIDIGPTDATEWLSEHGAGYGLCRVYGNEPWHYELRPSAIDRGCPTTYADPTHDPRMRP